MKMREIHISEILFIILIIVGHEWASLKDFQVKAIKENWLKWVNALKKGDGGGLNLLPAKCVLTQSLNETSMLKSPNLQFLHKTLSYSIVSMFKRGSQALSSCLVPVAGSACLLSWIN